MDMLTCWEGCQHHFLLICTQSPCNMWHIQDKMSCMMIPWRQQQQWATEGDNVTLNQGQVLLHPMLLTKLFNHSFMHTALACVMHRTFWTWSWHFFIQSVRFLTNLLSITQFFGEKMLYSHRHIQCSSHNCSFHVSITCSPRFLQK